MKSARNFALATMMGVCAVAGAAEAAGNAEDGEAVFRKCTACHRVGDGAKNQVGPILNGVIGRRAGTSPDYSYSELNKAAGTSGLEWTEATIFEYLEDPNAFLRKFLTTAGKADLAQGQTKMPFKLTDKNDRENVVAYLKKFSSGK